jgi:membrane protein implicated in regulation of membrane protease activity
VQTFLAVQIFLSATPLLLFVSFTVGTLFLSLITAAVFSLFWIGVALLVLIPTLFVTVSIGIAVWIWLVSSFLIARWVYNVVPINVRGKTEVGLPNGRKAVVTKSGEGYGDLDGEVKNGN